MKPEKMTDEDLEHELSQALSASRAAKVRAHIAALTAERDEALGKATGAEIERLKRNTREAQQYASEAVEERNAAESALAAIRQRAGDADAVWSAFVRGRVPSLSDMDGALSVIRYVVGEDGAGPGRSHEWDGSPVEAAEPTTAEAFATVRAELLHQQYPENGPTMAALSLLERRMGAMERAARLVLGCGGVAGFDKLRSALTGGPPVFTLEEVERALAVAKVGTSDAPRADPALVLRTLREMRR